MAHAGRWEGRRGRSRSRSPPTARDGAPARRWGSPTREAGGSRAGSAGAASAARRSGGWGGNDRAAPPVYGAGSAAAGAPPTAAAGEEGDTTVRSGAVERANFGLSGALAEDAATGNVYKGVVLKWSEPPDAATPGLDWQLHVFKGDKALAAPLHISAQSAFLVGRDRAIADIPVDHPSCSKQHAVLQFRGVTGPAGRRVVRPYLLDLDSANGTRLNGEAVAGARYIQLKVGDVLRFGASSREYVLLHDKAAV